MNVLFPRKWIGFLPAIDLNKYVAQVIVNYITPERIQAAVKKLQQEPAHNSV